LSAFSERFNHRDSLKQVLFDALKCIKNTPPKPAQCIHHGGSR
jgi:hypothetical protein